MSFTASCAAMGETVLDSKLASFAAAYAEHREFEGRRLTDAELLALPWLRSGPQAHQWAVRARTFQAFLDRLLGPMAAALARPMTILDLGAGNGWLSRRVASLGHEAIALDIRGDDVDGLGAAGRLAAYDRFERTLASFDAIPLADGTADLTVFNASIHYAVDLPAVLAEARRVARRGGAIAILDSPFYRREGDGQAMVDEKRRSAGKRFGDRAEALTSLDSIEFLTRARLEKASGGLGLHWDRHRVRYPIAYELRPVAAALTGRRAPSRFDLWAASVR